MKRWNNLWQSRDPHVQLWDVQWGSSCCFSYSSPRLEEELHGQEARANGSRNDMNLMVPQCFPECFHTISIYRYLSYIFFIIFHDLSENPSVLSTTPWHFPPRSPMRSFTRSSRSNSSSPARSGRRGRTAATEKMKQEDEWALG